MSSKGIFISSSLNVSPHTLAHMSKDKYISLCVYVCVYTNVHEMVGRASSSVREVPTYVCVYVNASTQANSGVELLGAVVASSLYSQNSCRSHTVSTYSRNFLGRLFTPVSVVCLFLFGESQPHRLLLPFLLYHHPLPILSLPTAGPGWLLPLGPAWGRRAEHKANWS